MKWSKRELREGLFAFCACLSVTLLLVSNIAAVKLWDFGGLAVLDGGMIAFPLTFVLADVMVEIWGERRARFVVWCGFFMCLVMTAILGVVQILPPGIGWQHQAAYEATLGFLPRVVLGSLVSYLVAQLLNITAFVKIRQWTGQKKLWVRMLGSSLVANLVNSLVFCGIVFGGVISVSSWWAMVMVSCTLMVVGEAVLTPVAYWVVGKMRRLVDSRVRDE